MIRAAGCDSGGMINQQQLWDEDAAQQYDTPGEGMFSPEVLGPTVEVLSRLAGDGPAVEFAIGTGRVAIPLREAGVQVSGIELSHAMISRLREKVGEDHIPVVQADMTEAAAGENFSLAFLVFNTIANLLTQDEQVRCFQNAARHLVLGGRFVIELWVPQLRSLPPGHRGTVEPLPAGLAEQVVGRVEVRAVGAAPRQRGATSPAELCALARGAAARRAGRWIGHPRHPLRSHDAGCRVPSRALPRS